MQWNLMNVCLRWRSPNATIVFTVPVSEKCVSSVYKMFQGHMSSTSNLARNARVTSTRMSASRDKRLWVMWSLYRYHFTILISALSNYEPWNVQIAWHSLCTAWRSHIASSILNRGKSNFLNNFWRIWRSASSRSNSQIVNYFEHWCLCFNPKSSYQYQRLMASHDTNINNNANPAAHSLNIIPTKFGNHALNSFSYTLAQVVKV